MVKTELTYITIQSNYFQIPEFIYSQQKPTNSYELHRRN